MAQLVGISSCSWKVTDLIPSQGTCLGCRFNPWCLGTYGRQLIDASLLHWFFSLSPSKNNEKMFLGEEKRKRKEKTFQTLALTSLQKEWSPSLLLTSTTAETAVRLGLFLPTLHSKNLLTDSWVKPLYLSPQVQSHLNPSDATNCVCEILERNLFALFIKKVSTGQESLKHATNAFSYS